MLKTSCINPRVLAALAHLGHGDRVLLVDANYPLAMRSGEAEKVYLGVLPGVPTVPEVLQALCGVCNFEKIEAMVPADGSCPEVLSDVQKIMGDTPLAAMGRFAFYDAACRPDVALAISTGESRTYACLILTVGVV